MEHYIVINDWATEYESGVDVKGVAHALEEAKHIFNQYVDEERDYAKKLGWTVYEDGDVCFDAGKNGYYVSAHSKLYIQRI